MKRSQPRARRWSRPLWAVAALLVVNIVLIAAQPGLAVTTALPNGLASYLFGPRLVRAEVVLKDGTGLHDFRIDRGRIRTVTAGSVTLLERDRSLVTIDVAATAEIFAGGRRVQLRALRRGMLATVIRDGDAPAIEIRASR